MANGGFSPAYNIQFATDTKTKIIVGLQTTTQETDYGLIEPMQKQIIARYGRYSRIHKELTKFYLPFIEDQRLEREP